MCRLTVEKKHLNIKTPNTPLTLKFNEINQTLIHIQFSWSAKSFPLTELHRPADTHDAILILDCKYGFKMDNVLNKNMGGGVGVGYIRQVPYMNNNNI